MVELCNAVEGNLASLERHLKMARGHDHNAQLLDELEQIVKEIRMALPFE